MLKTGLPGAFADKGKEEPDFTSHRVCALLGRGLAPSRRRNVVIPDCSETIDSRRVAVRSSALLSPKISTITTATDLQRTASFPARNTATGSRTSTRRMSSNLAPNSTRPEAKIPPLSHRARSLRIQIIFRLSTFARRAKASVKPLAAAEPPPSAA